MLSKLILDKLIPLPTEDEELEAIKMELTEAGFVITNFKSGGIFHTLIRIFIRIKVEMLTLARTMLGNVFLSSADNVDWLELRSADFGKTRKQALKTQGNLTLTRTVTTDNITVPAGYVFKTEPDSDGNVLRYISTSAVVFTAGSTSCSVPVEAESAGSDYNVPAGKITQSLIHIEGVTGITNAEDWITREGSDIEDIESLRSRALNSFSDLATNPTAAKYKSVCEAVEGVLYVSVDDQHPRGQGTIDIIVTSSTGSATQALLDAVLAVAETIAGLYDNLLVKASDTVGQNIAVTIVLPMLISDSGVAETAKETIRNLFIVSRNRTLSELYLSDLIVALKVAIPTAKSIRITEPAADVILSTDKVIVLGDCTVTIERA